MNTQTKLPPEVFRRLCALQKKLHRWAEEECNGSIQWDDDACTVPRRYHLDRWGSYTIKGERIPNKEAQWLMQAEQLAAQCGGRVYHQGDPRGCALYFYRDSDLEGRAFPIDSIYSSVALPCC